MEKKIDQITVGERGAQQSLRKTLHAFVYIVPISLGMLLLTSLVLSLLPQQVSGGLFGHGAMLDTLTGAAMGSIAVGHPLASYLLGGELLDAGVGLEAVTVLMQVVPVLVLVFILLFLVDLFMDERRVRHYFGMQSGFKGWLVVLGPIIRSYPFVMPSFTISAL